MKRNKKIVAFTMLGVMLLGIAPSAAHAASLADSFSGGSDIASIGYSPIKGTTWEKTAWAKTSGYYNSSKRHYVRAYIGSMDSGNLWADSGRRFAYGDVKATCSASIIDGNQNTPVKLLFPKAYAKYGME